MSCDWRFAKLDTLFASSEYPQMKLDYAILFVLRCSAAQPVFPLAAHATGYHFYPFHSNYSVCWFIIHSAHLFTIYLSNP